MKSKYTIEYLYLGERVDYIGGINQVFRNKKGKFCHYTGVKGVYFGESYMVTKEGQIKSSWPEQPKKQTLLPTEQDKLDYESHKELAKDARARRKKAMDLKKPHQDITKAIALLKPFARSMDNITLRRFTGYIENQLSRRSKK